MSHTVRHRLKILFLLLFSIFLVPTLSSPPISTSSIFPVYFSRVSLCSTSTNTLTYACVQLSHFSCVWLFATLWAVAHQAPLSMGFPKQKYWSGLPCPPADLPESGSEPESLKSPALAGRFLTTSAPWEAPSFLIPFAFCTKQAYTTHHSAPWFFFFT